MDLDFDSLAPSFRRLQLAHLALRLRLPALLAGGPRTVADLAEATRVPAERLRRVLRGLVWAGFLEARGDTVVLADAGHLLLDEAPGGDADHVRFQAEFFYRSWAELEAYVTEGANPYERANGETAFARIARRPELAALFNRSMSVRTAEYSGKVSALPVFDRAGCVVDVGGGEGRLTVDLLRAHPAMRGVVFDLPAAQEAAGRLITAAGMAERCRFVGGDMLAGVPAGGDVYVLKWILHDWDDAAVEAILGRIREQVAATGRLLVIERVMPADLAEGAWLAEADLNMLCLNGGAERTAREFGERLAAAGFRLESAVEIEAEYGFHAFTAAPA